MIDVDLASLYETETKRLKQQVERGFQRARKGAIIGIVD
ncbi:MAG: hypothetical protein IPG08_13670 [Sphingobacteriaceae bacterium]|nr:hypothetical protein [Sphingobacteriaceae bacterium]